MALAAKCSLRIKGYLPRPAISHPNYYVLMHDPDLGMFAPQKALNILKSKAAEESKSGIREGV